MQSFEDLHRYPLSAAAVLERFTDPAFLLKKYAALGREEIEVLDHSKDQRQARLRVRYFDKPDMDVPSFARALVPERQEVIQEVSWDLQRRSGRISVGALNKAAPVKVQGEMRLQDEGGGSTNTVRWQITVSVPLIGGKLEKLLIEGLKKKSRRDEQVSRELFAKTA